MKKIIIQICILLSFHCLKSEAQLCDLLTNNANTTIITAQCLKQLQVVCKDTSTLWKMFDASSKYPPTGLSYSDGKDLGNFDECMSIKLTNPNQEIKGKYCGFSVAVINPLLDSIPPPYPGTANKEPKTRMMEGLATFEWKKPLEKSINELIIKPKSLTSPSMALLSVCIPQACTPSEVGHYFISGLDEIALIAFSNAIPCMSPDSNSELTWGSIVFIAFLSVILLLMILSTTYEIILHYWDKKPLHPILLAFSVFSNGRKLFKVTTTKNSNQITCLNGLRFISMMWVISGHNFAAFEAIPLINYMEVGPWFQHVWIMYAGAAPIAVDTFFFLSGFLFTVSFLKSGQKLDTFKQVIGFPMMVLHRYLRLTPAAAVLYFASITIIPMLNNGPLWDIVVQPLKESCTHNWWTFFLYIQNYVNYDNICLNHTWYISADMQMFILSPLVLIPTSYFLKKTKTLFVLAALCAFTAFWVVIPMMIRFLDWTIDNVYDTHSRFNDYLIGVMLGVAFVQFKDKPYVFNKLVNLGLWVIVFAGSLGFFAYYHTIVMNYEHTSDTLFYGLYRPLWCSFLAFMVYSCHHGHGGPVNSILSLGIFQVGARLSYCMYLLHAVIILYWVGIVRNQMYWGDYQIFYVWCGHFIVTMILSVIWTLAFESPMIIIEKFLFSGFYKKPAPKQNSA